MEKTCFFTKGVDPFAIQKNIDHFILMLSEADKMKMMNIESGTLLKSLLNRSLWGNKSDMSQLTKRGC